MHLKFTVMLDKTNTANQAAAAKVRTNFVVIEESNELVIKTPRQVAGLVNPFQIEKFLEFLQYCDQPGLLQELLSKMLINQLQQEFGSWMYSKTELDLYGTLISFISGINRKPTEEEQEN